MQQKNFKLEFLGEEIPCWYVKEKVTALKIVEELMQKDCLFAIDTETAALPKYKHNSKAGLSPHLSDIRLLQVYDGKNSIIFDSLSLGGLDFAVPFLESKRFLAHNAIFDLQFFYKIGVKQMNLGCTRILYKLISQAYYPVDTGLEASLGAIVESVLKVDVSKILQRSDWSEPDLTFEQVQYAALDPVLVMKVAERLASGIQKHGLKRIYDLSKAAQAPLAKMQMNGLLLDVEAHKKLIVQWRADAHTAKKEVLKLTGLDDITSQKIGDWLEINLPEETLKVWPKTPGGKISTDAHTFADFSDLDIVEPFLKFQKATTLAGTFGQNLINKINPVTGRIHCGYNIAGARTGRLSSSNPNFQNAPRAKEFRSLFIARPGKSLVIADYSQIELRVAAELSRDKAMLKVYRDGEDIYKVTAARLNKKKLEDVTKEERQVAKALALGLLFGLGVNKFAHYAKKGYGVDLSQQEAENSDEAFRQLYPDYREWQLEQAAKAKISLTATTPCGKKRRLPEDETYGNSMNQPIQGGAAEIMLHALVRLDNQGLRLLNTVHDEVIIEVEQGEEEAISNLVRHEMTQAYLDVFPNGITNKLVSINHGSNWAEAK